MKRPLKIIGIVLGSLIGLLLLAAVLIPVLFKDEINAKVKAEINKNLNAVVEYKDFDLSLFTNFPYLTIKLQQFSIAGKGMFEKDTLAAVEEFQLAVNLMNVINGEKIGVRKVVVEKPTILLKTLADGRANYLDILPPDSVPPPPDTATSFTALSLDRIVIREGNVTLMDKHANMFAKVNGLNFKGSGNLMQDAYDFDTQTDIASLIFDMDKTRYANKLKIDAAVNLGISDKNSKFTFKDNKVKINDFQVGFDGYVQLKDKETVTDVKFHTLETRFKNILSLVPGVYTKSFEDIKTDGTLALDGWVQGAVRENETPTFYLKLKVDNGFMQYPDLPSPVKNIGIDVEVANQTPNLQNTTINLNRFHAELDKNPVDAKMRVVGLDNPAYDGNVSARVNLEELTKIFPIEDLTLKGQLAAKLDLSGTASDTSLPKMDGSIDLKYGYLKSKQFPAALENLTFQSKIENATGQKKDMKIDVQNFHTDLEKEPIDANLFVANLDNPEYKLKLKGVLDLAKLLKIYPIEGMNLSGIVRANIDTEGKMSTATSGDYANLPTTGTLNVENLKYSSKDLAQPFDLKTADFEFNNQFVKLSNFDAKIGSSDVKLNGKIVNFIGYLFAGQTIKGDMQLTSNVFNVNEWMTTAEPAQSPEAKPETKTEAVEIPGNVDFQFNSSIGKILYDKYDITNFIGMAMVKDRAVSLVDMRFNMLGGLFRSTGKYATPVKELPNYDFAFNVDSLDINKVYTSVEMMQKAAPVAKDVSGRFNLAFRIAGKLTQEMSPVYETMTGGGMANIIQGKMTANPLMEKVNEATKIKILKDFYLVNTQINFHFENGRIHVAPFYIKSGDYLVQVSGSNGFDQTIDYNLKFDVPAAAIAGPAAAALGGLLGQNLSVPQNVKVDLRVGGTVTKPTIAGVKFDGAGAKEGITNKLNEEKDKKIQEAKALAEKARAEAEAKARAEADRLKNEAAARANAEAERLRKEADKKKAEAEAKVKAEAEKAKRDAEAKAKAEADRLKKEAENKLKNNLKWPR